MGKRQDSLIAAVTDTDQDIAITDAPAPKRERVRSTMARFGEKVEEVIEKSRVHFIPLELIEDSEYWDRGSLSHDEDFQDLVASMRATKHNEVPVKVVRLGSGPEKYRLVYGHRRKYAAMELGLPSLRAIVETDRIDPKSQIIDAYNENNRRADIPVFQQGLFFKVLLKGDPSRNIGRAFQTMTELAKELGISNALVTQTLQAAEIPRPLIAALDLWAAGRPTLKALYDELSEKAFDEEQDIAAAKKASGSNPTERVRSFIAARNRATQVGEAALTTKSRIVRTEYQTSEKAHFGTFTDQRGQPIFRFDNNLNEDALREVLPDLVVAYEKAVKKLSKR